MLLLEFLPKPSNPFTGVYNLRERVILIPTYKFNSKMDDQILWALKVLKDTVTALTGKNFHIVL